MPRTIRTFFDPISQNSDDFIELARTESHHLIRVLRLGIGDKVEALDGKGLVYKTIIEEIDSSNVRLSVIDKTVFTKNTLFFQMCISLIKGNRWEDMIRPLTELGVNQITPLETEFSESNLKNKNIDERILKWEKIAQDACKQSGNPWMPKFDRPQKFSSVVTNLNDEDDVLFASLSSFSRKCKDIQLKNTEKITIFVGPEGGWSAKEEAIAKATGFNFFTFGSNTLRVETAALSGLTVARENFLL